MTTLDNPNTAVPEQTVPFLPTALRYGVIAGMVLVVYTLLSYLLDFSVPTSMVAGILQLLLVIVAVVVIAVLVIRFHRNHQLGGYISFGRAFLVAFIALVVAGLISNLFNFLYITIIDPGYPDMAVAKMEEMFTNMGMEEAMKEEQMSSIKERFEPNNMLINGLLYGIIINALIAAIVAAIMKKKAPVV